jgi:peroxiredoxin
MHPCSRVGPMFLALLLCSAAAPLPQASAGEKGKPLALGEKVPPGAQLRDLRGNRRSVHDFKGYRALVLVFTGTDCPVSNLYLPELIEAEKGYRTKKVQFLAVYPNANEDLDQVAAHASDRDVPFPVLKDAGGKLAAALGVTRVPAVVVLDGEGALRYRGRVSDRYGAASRREKASREDLLLALDEVLAGKKVSVPETETDGCLLAAETKRPARAVTYSKDVAPILQKRCQECHRPEQSAPFALMTYDDAVKHARMIREVTSQRRMPPWHADSRHGKFSNDRRLARAEIDTLAAWIDAGMPRGADSDLPRPIDYPKGWKLGKPDLVIDMPEEFQVPATGVLPYKNWTIDPGFKEDRWVRLAEARPGAPGVVHHLVVYILQGGNEPITALGTLSVLVGWAPGDLGLVCPPETALRIPKGARLRIEMHYTPNGTAQKDRSSVGLTFAKEPPKFELFTHEFANMNILVPAHDPHYRADATLRFRADAQLLSFVPHMHWRGKDYRYEAIYPDGTKRTLLSVPRWDFNWQNVYRFAEPLKLPAGSKIHAVAHWDNSRNNPLNPAPDKSVRFGLQTWDEMMVGWASFVYERPEAAAELAKNPPTPADRLFDQLDTNGDEVLTADEIPHQWRAGIKLLAIKLPERMTRKEFSELFAKMTKRFGRPRPKDQTRPKDATKSKE